MTASFNLRNCLDVALTDPAATTELLASIVTKGAAVTPFVLTASAGSFPVASGAFVIGNTATPTNVELLDCIVELNARVNALRAALTASGVTL